MPIGYIAFDERFNVIIEMAEEELEHRESRMSCSARVPRERLRVEAQVPQRMRSPSLAQRRHLSRSGSARAGVRINDVDKGSVFALCGSGAHESISEKRRI